MKYFCNTLSIHHLFDPYVQLSQFNDPLVMAKKAAKIVIKPERLYQNIVRLPDLLFRSSRIILSAAAAAFRIAVL